MCFALLLAGCGSTTAASRGPSARPAQHGATEVRAFEALVGQTLDVQLAEFQNCRRVELIPGLPRAGEVQLRFRVTADGHVSGAWVARNTTGSESVAGCMLEQLTRVRLPTRTTGSARTYSRTITIRGREDASNLDRLVVQAIKKNLRRFQACYEWILPRAPTLHGRVVVRFNVGGTGQFRDAVPLVNTTGSEALAACIVSQFATLRVAPVPGQGMVPYSYPFEFAPRE